MVDCSKTKFANEKAALFYIEKLQATSIRSKIPNRAYLCEHCLTWHLTSTPQEESMVSKYKKRLQVQIELNKRLQAKLEKYKARIRQSTGTWRGLNR